MTFYISGKPTLHLKSILHKGKEQSNIFPLDQESCFFFFSARYALSAAIRALGLKPGNRVLIPAYNCGVEIDPFLYSNIEPVFYKVKKDLNVDLDDLIEKCDCNANAVLITHFLGFPQPIEKIKGICEEKNLLLIEDCAHALLSEYQGCPLGSYGDAAVFSLLKTLPVPNGGLLILNAKKIGYNEKLKAPNLLSNIFYLAELFNERTYQHDSVIKHAVFKFIKKIVYGTSKGFKLFIAAFKKMFNPKANYLVRPDSFSFEEELISWGISSLSKNMINNADFDQIKTMRRRNFQYLLDHFLKHKQGILPFQKLPIGVCPLFFPVILDSPEDRQQLHIILKKRGVTTHPWWDKFHSKVPWHEFPGAVYLKQRLIGFPIYQDLTFNHLDHLIKQFEEAYKNIKR